MTDPTPAHRFDLIAFDWDGTLFDSTRLIVQCIQAAVRDVGGSVPDERSSAYVIGMELAQALAHAAPDVPSHLQPQLGARYRHHYALQQHAITLFDGVLALLAELKAQGRTLAVATGKSRRGLDAALATVELAGLFDASRTADETAGKPDPLMLEQLMEQFGVAPGRTLMIGDTTHDLQMACNAGCASVGVAWGAHRHEDLHGCRPLAVVHSVRDLRDWLLAHG